MTNVYYNGVQIHNVLTRRWEQEVVCDASHTDVLYHRYRLEFEGYLHSQTGARNGRVSAPIWTAAGSGSNASFAVQSVNPALISSLLGQHRAALTVTQVNESGQEVAILNVIPTTNDSLNSGDRDVDNGPKPKVLSIRYMAGAKCWKIAWSVECAKVACLIASGRERPPWVLNNRWSIAETMDENWFLSRAIRGSMTLSAPTFILGKHFSYQDVVLPGLEPGFKRRSIDFTTTPDGLRCDYAIIDHQFRDAAPWPATRWKVSHTESALNQTQLYGECSVTLEGPPHAPRGPMISRAVQIMDARLKFLKKKDDDKTKIVNFVEFVAITEHFSDGPANVVEARMRVRHNVEDQAAFLNIYRGNIMGQPFTAENLPQLPDEPQPYDRQRASVPATYGYDPYGEERSPLITLLLQCALQTPCDDNHVILHGKNSPTTGGTTTPPAPSDPAGETTTTTYRSESEMDIFYQWIIGEYDVDISEDSRKRVYSHVALSSRYVTNRGRVQLPLGNATGGEKADTCKVFQIHEPVTRRIITFECEASGDWPYIPSPVDTYKDGDLTGTLLTDEIEPSAPSRDSTGEVWIYHISGTYVYALNRAPSLKEKLNVGVLPLMAAELSDTQFDPDRAYNAKIGP